MGFRKDGEIDRRAFTSKVNAQLAGRPRLFASKLREALIRKAEERADELADAIIKKALDAGSLADVPALKEVFDRGLGKALQQTDITTDGESLNERITKLDDQQLEQLIASVQGGVGGIAVGETAENQGESVEVRETAPEADTGVNG